MAQILFSVEIPPSKGFSTEPTYSLEWLEFEKNASTILKPVTSYTRHSRSAWLLPAENLWPVLMSMIDAAKVHNLAYSVLLISGEVTPMTPAFNTSKRK